MIGDKIKLFLKVDTEKFKTSDRIGLFWLDVFMIWLVIQNLIFFGFDWSFKFSLFRDLIYYISPVFYNWYEQKVHPNFADWDLIFVAIFLIEFIFRWGRAIRHNTYDIWWFYPFIHWYDVLGLVPMKGAFKLLRLFRLVGMFIKLQNMGVIDLSATRVYKQYKRFRTIFVEEISDLVIAKSLSSVQDELNKGIPFSNQIIEEIILPQKEKVIEVLAKTICHTVEVVYEKHRHELKRSLDTKVIQALQENKEIDTLRYLPGLGSVFQKMLDNAVSDVTFNVVDKVILDITQSENQKVIENIANDVLDNIYLQSKMHSIDSEFVVNIAHQILEVIKGEVLKKQYKNQ
ncbi:MAG TPA: hypothetical protein PK075_08075 [Chitinophagales bacterium]|nr:hypothetical protein [Bacteroidota bacterium]MCB9074135.1 hypothetical protein [Chitinophagales bacterium]HNC64586.1 hypothetical protein [Chitinophagales bacterium]